MVIAAELEAAIGNAIRTYLHKSGSWTATTSTGQEISFELNDTGLIGAYVTDDETGETEEFCFRLEIVED